MENDVKVIDRQSPKKEILSSLKGSNHLLTGWDVSVANSQKQILPYKYMKGRIEVCPNTCSVNVVQYSGTNKKSKLILRTQHCRCVLRHDGHYHVSIQTDIEMKYEKQAIIAELRDCLAKIEEDKKNPSK